MKKLIILLTFLVYILNTTVAQYDDSKWEFGAEAGFAWVGFPGQGLKIDILETSTQTTQRKDMDGFRIMASAKYNLIGRIQILGGLGLVKAKGEIRRSKTTEAFLFGGTSTFDEKIKQEYTLIDIPIYFRFYLLNERRSIKNGFNIFIDLGKGFKIPIKSNLSFSKSESHTPDYEGALQVKSFFGSYLALGFSINNKTTIAITSSRIRSQSTEYNTIKYWSRLRSLSATVFF